MLARQARDAVGFDEVMIVQYKSRFQFVHMALLDPHYWPLMCAPCAALPRLLRVCLLLTCLPVPTAHSLALLSSSHFFPCFNTAISRS